MIASGGFNLKIFMDRDLLDENDSIPYHRYEKDSMDIKRLLSVCGGKFEQFLQQVTAEREAYKVCQMWNMSNNLLFFSTW